MSEFLIAVAGGAVGGGLGALTGTITAYYGPKKLEEWRDERAEARQNGPRKKLLLQALSDERFDDGRRLTTLTRISGTPEEECRRLLIEIGARGVKFRGGEEGWALVERVPLSRDEQ
jgi:hypothetical protein